MTLISLKQDIECDDIYFDLDVTLTLQEQAVEREQEREDFQKEIQHLQMVVKDKERQEGHENRLQREVSIRIQKNDSFIVDQLKEIKICNYIPQFWHCVGCRSLLVGRSKHVKICCYHKRIWVRSTSTRPQENTRKFALCTRFFRGTVCFKVISVEKQSLVLIGYIYFFSLWAYLI